MFVTGPALDVRQPFFDDRFRGALERGIDGRVDAKAALVDALPAKPLDQFATNLLFEIETGRFLDLQAVDDLDWCDPRAVSRCLIDGPG